MIKKIFLFGLFCLAVMPSLVKAFSTPSLDVSDISLDGRLVAGKVVSGSFVLSNYSDNDATDLWFSVSTIVKQSDSASAVVERKDQKTVFSVGSESKEIVGFEYDVPSLLPSGKVFVAITVYHGNEYLSGYREKEVVVSGATSPINISEAYIKLDKGDSFGLLEGPVLYSEKENKNSLFSENASIVVKLNSADNVDLFPVMRIQSWPLEVEVFDHKFEDKSISLKKNENGSISVDLPTMNYTPGVFDGDMYFVDNNGNKKTIDLKFKYIISGDFASISSVTSNRLVLREGESLDLSVDVGGVPSDISNKDNEKRDYGNHTMRAVLKNELLEVVAQGSVEFGAMNPGVKVLSLKSEEGAKALMVEVDVLDKTGEVLAHKSTFLSADFLEVRSMALRQKIFNIVLSILAVILVLFGGFWIYKKKKKGLVFVFLSLILPLQGFASTEVYNTLNQGDVRCPDPGISVSFSGVADNQKFNPKETFTVVGSVGYKSCSNTPVNTYAYGKIIKKSDAFEFPKTTRTLGGFTYNSLVSTHYYYPDLSLPQFNWTYKDYGGNNPVGHRPDFKDMVPESKQIQSINTTWVQESRGLGANHGIDTNTGLKTLGTFTAPEEPGEYRFYASVIHKNGCYESWNLQYTDFSVKPASPLNLTATTGSSCSPDINLSWTKPTNMTGVEGFKLYRSTSQNGSYDLVATIASTETSYVDTLTSLVPGSFYYKLTAYDSESGLESDPATASYTYPPSCANGLCKTPPNNSDVTAEPVATTANLCDQGLLSTTEPFSSTVVRNESTERDQTTYNWKCVGTDENQKATCSATLQVTGLCTSQANLDSFNNINPSEMCDEGITAELKHTANGYTWKCYGSDPSRDVSCSFNDSTPVDGHCGTKNNQNVTEGYSFSETDLCLTGVKPVPSYADNTYTWACDGIEGGQSSGQCKAYTGSTQAECVTYPQGIENAPTGSGNLCVSGIAGDTVSSSGSKYIWSCASPDRTLVKICSANKSGYGVCGDRSYPLNTNQSLLCATGSTLVSSPSDQGDFYEWQCKGTNNNPDAYATCKSYKGPACATGLDFAEAPEANNSALCSIGTADEVVFNQSQNKFEWHCIKGNQTSSLCSATKTSVVPSIPAVSTGGRCNPQGVGQNIIDVTMTNTGGSLPVDYLVYRSTQSSNDIADYAYVGTVRMIRPNSLNLFADRNATPGTTYYYKVKAHNVAGDSGYSSKVFGSTPSVCRAPVSDCGVATERSMVYMPSMSTPDLCNVGAPSNFAFNSASSTFTWDCVTSSNTSECSAPKVDVNDVSCGSATASNFSSAPSITNPNLCNPGSASNVTEDSNGFSWKCSSADGSIETTCSASKACSGSCGGDGDYPSCGSAELVAMDSIPTENGTQYLCSSGTVVSGSISSTYGGYVWQCNLASKTTDCFAQKNGFVPPGVLCPSGSCIAEEGEVALRDLAAYPAIGNTGYQCTVFLGDQASSYSVFEKKDANTKCELTGPNGASIRVFSPNGEYQKTFPFTINTQSTYRLTCWQENDEGVKEQSSEVYKEVTCRINPSYVETSFIQRLFSNIRSMSASALNAFKSLFGSK